MGKLGNIRIIKQGSNHRSGAAFLLETPPEESRVIEIEKNWEVVVQEKNPYVVARGEPQLDTENVLVTAHEIIQKALDIFCIEGKSDLTCREVATERILWWPEDQTQHLRIVQIADLPVSMEASVTTDPPQPSPPPTKWHESLRYYRRSQATDELFAAYRNLFLALESIFSQRTPRNASESEGDWIKRSLRDAQQDTDLSKFSPNPENPVESIYGYQYEATRCAMFHAKQGKKRLQPQNVSDREHVQEALQDLSQIFISILQDTIHVNRSSGVITNEGFRVLVGGLLRERDLEFYISGSSGEIESDETLSNQIWQSSESIQANHSGELTEPGLESVLATTETQSLSSISQVQRIGLVADQEDDDKTLMNSGRLESPLTLHEIDVLEVQNGTRLNNQNTPRRFYPV